METTKPTGHPLGAVLAPPPAAQPQRILVRSWSSKHHGNFQGGDSQVQFFHDLTLYPGAPAPDSAVVVGEVERVTLPDGTRGWGQPVMWCRNWRRNYSTTGDFWRGLPARARYRHFLLLA